MRTKISFFICLPIMAIVVLSLWSCGGKKTESPADQYAQWIKAYSPSIISQDSEIIVEFNESSLNQTSDKLISFSPSVKGSQSWERNGRLLRFTPEKESFKPGHDYTASVNMKEITGETNLEDFTFSFTVRKKVLSVSADSLVIAIHDPNIAKVTGVITTSENPGVNVIAENSIRCDWKNASIRVIPTEDPCVTLFEISGIQREKTDKEMEIRVNAEKSGFKEEGVTTITIPGTEEFKLSEISIEPGIEPFVKLAFSESLNPNQNIKGLIELYGGGKTRLEQKENIVKIYFEDLGNEEVDVTINPEVSSFDGRKLRQGAKLTMKVPSLKPAVVIPLSGTILPDPSKLVLPFRTINLAAVDVKVIKIYENNILSFLQNNGLNGAYELRRCGRLVYSGTIAMDPERDLHKWQDFSIDLSGLFKQEPGAIYRIRLYFKKDYSLYGVDDYQAICKRYVTSASNAKPSEEESSEWDKPYTYYYDDYGFDWDNYDWDERNDPMCDTYYMESDRFPSCNLLSSQLGIISKETPDRSLNIFVNNLISAEPVSGADIKVYDYQLKIIANAKTDKNGMAVVKPSGKAFVIVAKCSGSTSYLKVVEGTQNSVSRFDTSGKTIEKGMRGFVYGERGVWRPGDTLHVSFIVYDIAGKLPKNHPATMELFNSQGQFHSRKTVSENTDGFYRFDIPTSPDDPTGTYNAYFKIGGASFHKAFPIETVKPNRLKIKLAVSEPLLKAGKNTNVSIESNWLSGPAANGLDANMEIHAKIDKNAFKGYEEYSFLNPISDYRPGNGLKYSVKLDNNGKNTTTIRMPESQDAPGMLKAQFLCTVEESAGGESIHTEDKKLSPFTSYVGVKMGGDEFETDTDLVFNYVVLDENGKKVSGHDIEYKIWKIAWNWWWDFQGRSLASYMNSEKMTPVKEGVIKKSADESSIKFKVNYPSWGRYLLYVKDLNSSHASGGVFVVDWPDWRGRSDKYDPEAVTMLSFSTDKKEYNVGEECMVFIPASDGGKALVTVENAGKIISKAWVNTNADSDTQYKFKLTPQMSPNIYVCVSLIQPYSKAEVDRPLRLYGIQSILVTNPQSHLNPQIEMPDVIRPLEPFKLKVREEDGKPMTYTLAIVDEGLLDLTNFKTPDPWKAIYCKEALGIKTWDMYDDIAGAYGGKFSKIMSIGGDEGINKEAQKDKRFNPVVKYLGPFKLEKGSDTHIITLPMYAGSVRVMLVAGHDGAYGNAEKTVPVRTPVMILPSLPASIKCNETVSLPVNVFATEKGVNKVTVSVSVKGPVTIVGPSSQDMSFSEPGDKLMRFTLRTNATAGSAKVIVKAEGGGCKVSDEINVIVNESTVPVTTVTSISIPKNDTQTMKWDGFKAREGEYASLTLSTCPSINADKAFEYFNAYSHYCSEQLSSKLISYLKLNSQMKESSGETARAEISSLLSRLYLRQLRNGSFVLWPNGREEEDKWVTSMVGDALIAANNAGIEVEKSVMDSWLKYQKRQATGWSDNIYDHNSAVCQAYRLFTLALSGNPELGAMNRMKEKEKICNQAKCLLAAAYAACGQKSIGKSIIDNLSADSKPDTYWLRYDSDLRDKEIMLRALLLLDEQAKSLKLAEEIVAKLNGGQVSTQEYAFGALAFSLMQEKVSSGNIIADVDGKEMEKNATSLYMGLETGKGAVKIENKSDGSMLACLTVRKPMEESVHIKKNENGIALNIVYYDGQGTPIDCHSIAQGSEFFADIHVKNISHGYNLENLALTFNLPSGWEVFNDRLFSGKEEEEAEYTDIRDDKVMWYFDLEENMEKCFTVSLRAAFEGKYILPATICEAMYDPSTFSNSESSHTEVCKQ